MTVRASAGSASGRRATKAKYRIVLQMRTAMRNPASLRSAANAFSTRAAGNRLRWTSWGAGTGDIRAPGAVCPEPLGKMEAMSRGELDWLITIPRGGRLPLGGVAPALIEWRTQGHPAARLRETGCTLLRLEAFHP